MHTWVFRSSSLVSASSSFVSATFKNKTDHFARFLVLGSGQQANRAHEFLTREVRGARTPGGNTTGGVSGGGGEDTPLEMTC